MSALLVDTHYLIASINPKDQWHEKAVRMEASLTGRKLLITEAVLLEMLNYFSGFGPKTRLRVVGIVHSMLQRVDLETIPLTHESFLAGVELYKARLDKNYSLTDCISINVMRGRGITDVLTHDRNFEQEGFKLLL